MIITVFQALTLLAEKYRNNLDVYQDIKSMYLSGLNNSINHAWLLDELLGDELLKGYLIDATCEGINADPVRRYFESHLSVETLANSLDDLKLSLLKKYYSAVLNLIKSEGLIEKYKAWRLAPEPGAAEYQLRMENIRGIEQLKKADSYQYLKPQNMDEDSALNILADRKNKMLYLANISFASLYLVVVISDLPLGIYHDKKGPFNKLDRGRRARVEQKVHSQTLGIMRSYMALPIDDALFSQQPTPYRRSADRSTFVFDTKQPNQGFASLVTPFVNSISGTMLAQLKVMAELVSLDDFVYHRRHNQLKLYFKNHIAYMLYHTGGHSLDEYVRVFQLNSVQNAFINENAFNGLTLNTLFKDENSAAFEAAVSKTIVYNQQILNKKKINMKLIPAIMIRTINKKTNEATSSCVQDKTTFFHAVSKPDSEVSRESISSTSVTFHCRA